MELTRYAVRRAKRIYKGVRVILAEWSEGADQHECQPVFLQRRYKLEVVSTRAFQRVVNGD